MARTRMSRNIGYLLMPLRAVPPRRLENKCNTRPDEMC
jgi:hypothetical protein